MDHSRKLNFDYYIGYVYITVGSIYDPTNEIVSEKHYYPFGLDMTGAWFATVVPDNTYRYNGKELEEATGL